MPGEPGERWDLARQMGVTDLVGGRFVEDGAFWSLRVRGRDVEGYTEMPCVLLADPDVGSFGGTPPVYWLALPPIPFVPLKLNPNDNVDLFFDDPLAGVFDSFTGWVSGWMFPVHHFDDGLDPWLPRRR